MAVEKVGQHTLGAIMPQRPKGQGRTQAIEANTDLAQAASEGLDGVHEQWSAGAQARAATRRPRPLAEREEVDVSEPTEDVQESPENVPTEPIVQAQRIVDVTR